jgi:nitrogen-specific signal transduction histidine kinase/CheY-like chemotaxis protein
MEITALDMKFGGRPARLVMAQDVTGRPQPEHNSTVEHSCEIIGRVAGGFAHHFNNILTIIDGHASLLLRNSSDDKMTEQLNQISAAANRAATLTRQLVAAGGRQMVRPEPVDLNRLVQNQIQMLQRLAGKRIALQTTLGPAVPLVLAESSILEHILVHLVLNARNALQGRGTIEIQTSSEHLNEGRAKRHPEARPGEFVRLSVQDNGCGMSAEVQAHLFEPFFTTHDVGKGTGLGLASIRGEVKQLSGWIEFSSQVDVGTQFSIFLPCASKADTEVVHQTPPLSLPERCGTVLLVEPQDRARGVARYILNRHGYHVIEADSTHVAEVLWEGQSAKIDLLLTDVNPGGSSGQDFVTRLRQTRPDLKVVFTIDPSSDEPLSISLGAVDGAELLTKPYSPDKLLKVVQGHCQRLRHDSSLTSELMRRQP